MEPVTTDLNAELGRLFGFRAFREPQEEIVRDMLEGRDVLVVLPTGGGKSLCYQLPALLSEGLTVVVSPLIALMKDQVDALRARGAPVAVFHSLQSQAERGETLRMLDSGTCRLLYVAPERFRASGFLERLREQRIDRFAVDEAHCLSQWGHDFRPDYLRLGTAVRALGHPPVAAFTATATPVVRKDIARHLELRDPVVRVSGFARPNLSFRVRRVSGEREKMERVGNLVRQGKTGIIYCATRKRVEKVASALADQGASVVSYHGGMDGEAREQAQNRFMAREFDIAVATNAFGMGIDRADVRFVIHYELPGSPEAYYQEAGRAGRDGAPADCELLYNYADRRTQEFFIEGSNPDPSLIRRVYDLLRDAAGKKHEVLLPVDEITDLLPTRENPMAVSTSISHLARHGWIERFDVAGRRLRGTRILRPGVKGADLEIDEAALREKRRRDDEKLEAVIRFCEHSEGCRQGWILDYFGEANAEDCGLCDCCDAREDPDLRAPSTEEQLLARQALSGVARMSRRSGPRSWIPRFGKAKVIDCLLGVDPGGAASESLTRLSTFGILSDLSRKKLLSLFQEFQKRRYLSIERDGHFPLLALTDRGVAVVLDGKACHLDWDAVSVRANSRKSGRSAPSAANDLREDADPDLFARLKELRRRVAVERGVPAFTVFHDRTLAEMAAVKPETIDEALRIKGIGPAKAERELPLFLEAIRTSGPDPARPARAQRST